MSLLFKHAPAFFVNLVKSLPVLHKDEQHFCVESSQRAYELIHADVLADAEKALELYNRHLVSTNIIQPAADLSKCNELEAARLNCPPHKLGLRRREWLLVQRCQAINGFERFFN